MNYIKLFENFDESKNDLESIRDLVLSGNEANIEMAKMLTVSQELDFEVEDMFSDYRKLIRDILEHIPLGNKEWFLPYGNSSHIIDVVNLINTKNSITLEYDGVDLFENIEFLKNIKTVRIKTEYGDTNLEPLNKLSNLEKIIFLYSEFKEGFPVSITKINKNLNIRFTSCKFSGDMETFNSLSNVSGKHSMEFDRCDFSDYGKEYFPYWLGKMDNSVENILLQMNGFNNVPEPPKEDYKSTYEGNIFIDKAKYLSKNNTFKLYTDEEMTRFENILSSSKIKWL